MCIFASMKITKIKTRLGEFGAPVTTELDGIVERMRSTKTKEAADPIARVTLHSRLMMQKGMPRYFVQETDSLPYLVFSTTFGRKGSTNQPRRQVC